jgi:hypothetical protein
MVLNLEMSELKVKVFRQMLQRKVEPEMAGKTIKIVGEKRRK